jgi:hypothetical protein
MENLWQKDLSNMRRERFYVCSLCVYRCYIKLENNKTEMNHLMQVLEREMKKHFSTLQLFVLWGRRKEVSEGKWNK